MARGPAANIRELIMDDIARGLATAALTLQSVLLQALVNKGVMVPGEALEVVDKSLGAVREAPGDLASRAVAQAAYDCLESVREGVADLFN
jgi:hypothetical protein